MKRNLVNNNHPPPPPLFFVSVASKGFRLSVSSLFSPLAREFASVDSKRPTDSIQRLESRAMRHEDFKELESRGRGAGIRPRKELRKLRGGVAATMWKDSMRYLSC